MSHSKSISELNKGVFANKYWINVNIVEKIPTKLNYVTNISIEHVKRKTKLKLFKAIKMR